jgi:hypothetical protein
VCLNCSFLAFLVFCCFLTLMDNRARE